MKRVNCTPHEWVLVPGTELFGGCRPAALFRCVFCQRTNYRVIK